MRSLFEQVYLLSEARSATTVIAILHAVLDRGDMEYFCTFDFDRETDGLESECFHIGNSEHRNILHVIEEFTRHANIQLRSVACKVCICDVNFTLCVCSSCSPVSS